MDKTEKITVKNYISKPKGGYCHMRIVKRKYKTDLLDRMKQGQREETVKGVKILVKPIPEGGEDGDMDGRVYKSMRMAGIMMKLMPKGKPAETILEKVLPLRQMFNTYKGAFIADEGVHTEYVTVKSSDGYEVPVRIYCREAHGEGLPVFVYYHGGGFFGGGPDIVEQMCKLLVQLEDTVVFSVDYRLCPENHYPKPLDDCFGATVWAYENAHRYGGDRNRLAVSGDSAGGNLAAVVTLRDREEGTGMVKGQVLLYPAVNLAGKHTEFYKGVHMEAYRRSARHKKVLEATLHLMSEMLGGAGSSSNMLEDIYLQGHLPSEHIYASPLLDDMHGLPPTLLLFGEHDFLVFEDFAYAQTLTGAGVPLKTVVYRGMGHGFADQIGVAPQAEDCMMEIAEFIRKTL